MTPASRRFIDLIGPGRLVRGSQILEPSLASTRETLPIGNGKIAVICSIIYPWRVFLNPYLPGSEQDRLYVSGCATERADLADIVRRCGR